MDSSSEDKTKGTFHEAKGKIKEETDKMIGNRDLEAPGTAEKNAAKVQKKAGDVKKVFGK